jgi:anti-sigma factor ChrR (cupin superfamily)
MSSVIHELEQLIDSWALGTLDARTAKSLVTLAEKSPALAERMGEALSAATALAASAATEPPPNLRNRLLDRIAQPEPEHVYVKLDPDTKPWRPTPYAGVWSKRLFTDPQTKLHTFLLKMDPNSTIPSHTHEQDEQCFLLEGDVSWGNEPIQPGGFVTGVAGKPMPPLTTRGGNLMLIIGPTHQL